MRKEEYEQTMSSESAQKRKREQTGSPSPTEKRKDAATGETVAELTAALDQSQSKIDELQRNCHSMQDEMDNIKSQVFQTYELEKSCRLLEETFWEDWEY